jgi:hypothetical protein
MSLDAYVRKQTHCGTAEKACNAMSLFFCNELTNSFDLFKSQYEKQTII